MILSTRTIAPVAVVTACLFCFSVAEAGKPGKGGGSTGPSYSIYHLDDYGGLVTDVYPSDLNDAGQIVGWVDDPIDGLKAAYWSTNVETGSSTLQLLADGIVANSINSNGEIAGAQRESDGDSIGRYWRSHDDVSPLPLFPLAGDEQSNVLVVNRDGVVGGWSDHRITGFDPRPGEDPNAIITLKTERHPVVWRIVQGSVQGPFELPNFLDIDPTANPDNGYGNAVSLNDNNQAGLATVVGSFYLSEEITAENPYGGASNSTTHAAGWTIAFDAIEQLVATVAVIANGAGAHHVNNQNIACGEIIESSLSPVAAVWSPGETILHRLRDVNENSGWHMNSAGLIVGWGWVDARNESGIRAVMWADSTSKMTRLDSFLRKNSSLGRLLIATAVNDHDVIVGTAANGGFLAVPQ